MGLWRTVLCYVFAALSLVFSAASGVCASSVHDYYTEIPGVTEKEKEAIELLKQDHPGGFFYGMLDSDETFEEGSGEISGFTKLVCDHLSRLFGVEFKPRIMGWGDLISGLDAREVDFTGELTATPERLTKYHMTKAIAERSLTLFRMSSRGNLDMIGATKPWRYAFLSGTTTYDRVRETSEVPFTAVFYPNYDDVVQALRRDEVDAFVGEGMLESPFEDFDDIVHQKYYPVTSVPVSLTTANPKLAPIVSVLQKHLDSGGAPHYAAMYEDGRRAFMRHRLFNRLSVEEKDFIQRLSESGRNVPIAVEFDNYPMSFYNKREQEWQGIAIDIIGEISYLTGLAFEPINASDEVWASVMDKLERGDAWMISELIRSRGREHRFLWAKEPYARDIYALISRADTPDMSTSKVLSAKVGLVKGTAYEETFWRLYPGHANTVVYESAAAGFDALESRKIDLLMTPRFLILSATHYNERPYFKVNIPIQIQCESYFGFNKDHFVLRSVVNKAQELVDCEHIEDRWKRRVFDYSRKQSEERIPYVAGVSLVALLIVLTIASLYRKSAKLSWMMGMTDALTKIPNRRFYDERIASDWNAAIRGRLYISLLTIDIDHFKRYNDTYGHPQGDILLQKVAEIFKNSLSRQADTVARTGGEEFCIILPNTDMDGALHMAETIRESVEAAIVPKACDGMPTLVTVSVGVAVAKPGPGDNVQDFVTASDKALYEAKESGRNRVCVSPHENC